MACSSSFQYRFETLRSSIAGFASDEVNEEAIIPIDILFAVAEPASEATRGSAVERHHDRLRPAVLVVLGVGLVIRVVLAFTTYGARIDMGNFGYSYAVFHAHRLHFYSFVNAKEGAVWVYHFPYFPGVLVWVGIAEHLRAALHVSFHTLVKLPTILADLAIAFVVQDLYRRRGRSSSDRLLALSVVALGPIFIFMSGFHGQFDALAILPSILALALWERFEHRHWRGVACGLLLAAGALVKPVAALPLVAFLADAGSWSERRRLLAAFAIPIIAVMAPFAVADRGGVLRLGHYAGGFAGLGGLSLLVQPSLVLGHHVPGKLPYSSAQWFLVHHAGLIALAGTAIAVILVLRRRMTASDGAYLVVLAFFVAFPFYARSYLCWLIPVVLVSGRLWLAVALEALGFAAVVAGEVSVPYHEYIYVALLLALFFVAAGAFGYDAIRASRLPPRWTKSNQAYSTRMVG